jgi:alanine racemase
MPTPHATARLEIDLNRLSANYQSLKALASGAEVAPVVKADAYGLGVKPVSTALSKSGAQTFFVARLSEGIELRKILTTANIYVLDGLLDKPTPFIKHNLRPVLNSQGQVHVWQGCALPCALHIDTGMNRLGVRPEDLSGLHAQNLSLIMSHLACADEPQHVKNNQQLIRFLQASEPFANTPKSMANSSGIFFGSDYHFAMVRPGIALYGGGPQGVAHPHIKAVVKLRARILSLRKVLAGESIGYGASFVAHKNMQVATLGLGYADGILRSASPKSHIHIVGTPCPLVGRVSMDTCGVDVSGLEVAAGDWVEVLNDDYGIDALAEASGTISYEILTRLGARFNRTYSQSPS